MRSSGLANEGQLTHSWATPLRILYHFIKIIKSDFLTSKLGGTDFYTSGDTEPVLGYVVSGATRILENGECSPT